MTRYFGKVCARHPELMGERLLSTSHCIKCAREKVARYKAKKGPDLLSRVKADVLDHYGRKCERCPECDPDALTVDHEKQDGATHRRIIACSGQKFYRWIRANNFPPGFRILCFNCNIKAYRKHQRETRRCE